MTQKSEQVNIVTRLDPEVYQVLENKMSRLGATSTTTPIEAGFQLGVQAVLKELRVGYVVEKR